MSDERKLRIGQVIPYPVSQLGGVAQHALNLSRRFRERGHYSKVISPRSSAEDKDTYDDHVIYLGSLAPVPTGNGSIAAVSIVVGMAENPVKKLLEEQRFDVIHFHEPDVPFLSQQIQEESSAVNVCTFHADRNMNIWAKGLMWVFQPISRRALSQMDGMIAVSEVSAAHLKGKTKNIRIIPNGIDLKTFNTEHSKIEKFDDDKLSILFIGRQDKRKGLDVLIKAFETLRKKHENIRLVICGSDSTLGKQNREYVKKRDIPDVHFEGFISEEDKPRYLVTADIACFPATCGESFGIVLLEAMACGTPVIGGGNPGYRTVLKGKGSLLLVEPGSVDDLMAKLEALIQDEELRTEMSEWGLEEVKKYSWEDVTDQVLDVYRECLSKKES